MRYPIVIEPGTDTTAFGVIVPDLPGCFSAGEAIPAPSSLDALRQNPDYAGWMFGIITVDAALLDDTIEHVNITLPRRVLRRLDALAQAAGESRSGYIAHRTLETPPARSPH